MAYAQDWTLSDLTAGTIKLCMSSDGAVAYATVFGVGIYKSVDYGATWTATSAAANTYLGVDCSADGVYIFAVSSDNTLYRSTDSGANWATVTVSTLSKYGVKCSDSGQHVYIRGGSTGVYYSSDYGSTFTRIVFDGAFESHDRTFAISASGEFAFVGNSPLSGSDAALYISDYGATLTWITTTPIGTVGSVAMSADGQKLLLAVNNSGLRVSDDQGATWSSTAIVKSWNAASCTADFTKIIVGVGSQKPYVSEDSGATWAQVTGSAPTAFDWTSIAQTDDGSALVASSSGVYYSSTPLTTTISRLTLETLSPSELSAARINRLNLEALSPFADETLKRRPKFFTFLID